MPCAGTEALIAPDVWLVALDHRSVSVYELADGRPTAEAVVLIEPAASVSS